MLWNLQMKSQYIKAKYYYCHFYSHSICLCLEHSTASALNFKTNRNNNNNKNTPKRVASLWWVIFYEIMVVGKWHCFLGISHSLSPSGDSSLAGVNGWWAPAPLSLDRLQRRQHFSLPLSYWFEKWFLLKYNLWLVRLDKTLDQPLILVMSD